MTILLFLFTTIIGLACLIFWVACIIEIVKSEFKSTTDKLVWLILVLWLPVLGSLLYVGLGRKSRVQPLDEFV